MARGRESGIPADLFVAAATIRGDVRREATPRRSLENQTRRTSPEQRAQPQEGARYGDVTRQGKGKRLGFGNPEVEPKPEETIIFFSSDVTSLSGLSQAMTETKLSSPDSPIHSDTAKESAHSHESDLADELPTFEGKVAVGLKDYLEKELASRSSDRQPIRYQRVINERTYTAAYFPHGVDEETAGQLTTFFDGLSPEDYATRFNDTNPGRQRIAQNVNTSFTNKGDSTLLYYSPAGDEGQRLCSVREIHDIGDDYVTVAGTVASANKRQGLGLASLLDVTMVEAARGKLLSFSVLNKNAGNLALHKRYANTITDSDVMADLDLPLPQVRIRADSESTAFAYDFRGR